VTIDELLKEMARENRFLFNIMEGALETELRPTLSRVSDEAKARHNNLYKQFIQKQREQNQTPNGQRPV